MLADNVLCDMAEEEIALNARRRAFCFGALIGITQSTTAA
jgi:hypothetical protein